MDTIQLRTVGVQQQSEILLLNDYSYYHYKQSMFDPDKLIKSELRLICPRCFDEQTCPPYGEYTTCKQCGLTMHIHGSELICHT